MNVDTTGEFHDWFDHLTSKEQSQVEDRLDRIREHNHFGDKKYLGDDLFELRWQNGRRAYYMIAINVSRNVCLILLGGNKNGQKQDIARARQILVREAP
jgi:putative addiction module killer protein